MNNTKTSKQEALAKFLDVDSDLFVESRYDESLFESGSREYLVLTDEEADERAADYIKQSLWAFNPEFIASHTSVDLSKRAIMALAKMQSELCEDANDLVEALISDLDEFIKDAIGADGRGHFLNTYDGYENEEGDFFIYRIN